MPRIIADVMNIRAVLLRGVKVMSSGQFSYKSPVNSHEICMRNTSTCVKGNESSKNEDILDSYRNLIKDSETEKKVKLILCEFSLAKQMETFLPDKITEQEMERLLYFKKDQRQSYYLKYLRNRTLRKIGQKATRERKMEYEALENDLDDDDHICYGLSGNTLHFRLRNAIVRNFYAHRLAVAAKFGQPLVFDCDFEEHMNFKECMSTAKQLKQAYGVNLVHRDPFDIYFCNLGHRDLKPSLLECLERTIVNIHRVQSMITVTSKHYLELFPDKRKLVYLSPDAPEVMDKFDHDAIYIIGALSDLGPKVPRTMAKAKKEGIRCLKLPLDKHLLFKSGACKSLPLVHVTKILLDLQTSADWTKALTHVARRAVYSPEEIYEKCLAMQQSKFSRRR